MTIRYEHFEPGLYVAYLDGRAVAYGRTEALARQYAATISNQPTNQEDTNHAS